jgi:hypothetical protein
LRWIEGELMFGVPQIDDAESMEVRDEEESDRAL